MAAPSARAAWPQAPAAGPRNDRARACSAIPSTTPQSSGAAQESTLAVDAAMCRVVSQYSVQKGLMSVAKLRKSLPFLRCSTIQSGLGLLAGRSHSQLKGLDARTCAGGISLSAVRSVERVMIGDGASAPNKIASIGDARTPDALAEMAGSASVGGGWNGAPGAIRTPGLLVRSQIEGNPKNCAISGPCNASNSNRLVDPG